MSKQDALISEVLESEECIGDIDGLLSRHQSEANVLQRQVAEAERVAAKVRIAKWKADCAAKKREEEVSHTPINVQVGVNLDVFSFCGLLRSDYSSSTSNPR